MSLKAGGFAEPTGGFANIHIRTANSAPRGRNAFSALAPLQTLFSAQALESKNFQELFENLPPDFKRFLKQNYGDAATEELRALAQEKDEVIFYHGLLEIARRLDEAERPQAALHLRQFLSQHAIPSVAQSTAQHLAALRGEGPLGLKAQIFLDTISNELAKPSALLGFGLGVGAFRLTRLGAMSQLLSRPASLLTRGFGAELAAGSLGLAVESPAMVLGSHLGAAFGDGAAFHFEHLGEEILHGYATLGPLKLAASGVSRVSRSWILGNDVFSRFSRAALPQVGMWLGILGGMGLWQSYAPRDSPTSSSWLATSLQTWAHYNLSGIMARAWLGRGFQNWENRIELHTQRLSAPPLNPFRFDGPFGAEPMALAAGFGLNRIPSSIDPKMAGYLFMTGGKDSVSRGVRRSIAELRAEALKLRENIDIKIILDRTAITDQDRLLVILNRLNHSTNNASVTEACGTYFNFLIYRALRFSIDGDIVEKLDPAFNMMHDGGSVRAFEKLLTPIFPHSRLSAWHSLTPQFLRNRGPEAQRIELLPVSAETKNLLYRWAMTINKRREQLEYPEMSVDHFLTQAENFSWQPRETQAFEAAVKLSAESPLATLRMQRIGLILQDQDGLAFSKLREMGDRDLHIEGHSPSRWRFLNFLRLHPLKLRNTQYDAYLDHPEPLMLLYEIQKRWPKLLDEAAAEKRGLQRKGKLEPLVAALREKQKIETADVIQALQLLADPYSLRIAKEIKSGAFVFEMVDAEQYPQRVLHYDRQVGSTASQALPLDQLKIAYYYAATRGLNKGVMLMKSPTASDLAGADAHKIFFHQLKVIVHEFKHHRDMKPQSKRTREVEFREEMMAFGWEYLWSAEHGDIQNLKSFHSLGLNGFALHFRDKLETWLPVRH